MTELTERILEFQKTGEGEEDLVRDIYLIAYRFPKRKYGWSEDECGDFFCSVFNRIPPLLHRFKYTGLPFESYLYSTLHWQMRTYNANRRKSESYYKILSAPFFWETADINEPAVLYDPRDIPQEFCKCLSINGAGRISDRSSSLRIIFLILRNCEFVNDSMVYKISRLCGCTATWLSACIIHLRERLEKRRRIMNILQDKRNSAFFRICFLHTELDFEFDTDRSEQLLRKLENERQKLIDLVIRINNYPLYPTHREIAQVLGVPIGCVDSGLFYLKTTLGSLS